MPLGEVVKPFFSKLKEFEPMHSKISPCTTATGRKAKPRFEQPRSRREEYPTLDSYLILPASFTDFEAFTQEKPLTSRSSKFTWSARFSLVNKARDCREQAISEHKLCWWRFISVKPLASTSTWEFGGVANATTLLEKYFSLPRSQRQPQTVNLYLVLLNLWVS